MVDFLAAGWGLRALPRRTRLVGLLFGLLVGLLAACGSPEGSAEGSAEVLSGSPGDGLMATPGGVVIDPSGSGDAAGAALGLDRIGDLELQSTSYSVTDALEAEGGEELALMLESLGLEASGVELVIAVDPDGAVGISHWQLPGADAGEILSAWEAAADGSWRSETLAGAPALAGEGPDGGSAWATARDGVFLYVTTDDRTLAEAAASAISDP
ncbi:MAG: hypothetical protein ACRDGD_05190 [Candidatus Limnocylindria bacterium]